MNALDWLALVVYAALVLGIGARAGRGRQSASDLLVGRRNLPGWAVLCSMVATELSAATFIGVPHAAYTGDWAYFQFAFGALLAKLLLAARVIPLYHRLGVITVYGFLGDRFGPATHRAAACCFVLGRVLASGVRLFIAALAFAAVTGLDVGAAIVVSGAVAGLYTLAGGIRAVVWTDTLQGAVFLAAALTAVGVLASRAEGGPMAILAWADAAGRTEIFHTTPWIALADTRPFLVALFGGFFLTLASHATDHDMVQRLLSTRDGRSGGRALAGSALLNFPLTALFLFLGTGIAFLYATPPSYDIGDARQILPVFALNELPAGARGLLFAGLFAAAMSSLDSAICALASTWAVDVLPRARNEALLVRRTRLGSVAFCALLIAAALGMAAYHRALEQAGPGVPSLSLVELALSAMTILYGGLLGVFALGLLGRRRGSDASTVAGLVAGSVAGLALFLHPLALGKTLVAWPWWIPLAATIACVVAALGRATRGEPRRAAS